MINFKFEEIRKTEEGVDVIILHNYSIRPQDIKMWDLQQYSVPVKKDEEIEGQIVTKEEVLNQEVLTVTMVDVVPTFKEVEIPYYKNGKILYRKELREIQDNINHIFTGDEIKDILEQLKTYFI